MKNGRFLEGEDSLVWYKDDLIHCEGGPAITFAKGNLKGIKIWKQNNILHRPDGPAFERLPSAGAYQYEYYFCGLQLLDQKHLDQVVKIAKSIISGAIPFNDLPSMVNIPELKYFVEAKLSNSPIKFSLS